MSLYSAIQPHPTLAERSWCRSPCARAAALIALGATLLGCGRDPRLVEWTDDALRAERNLSEGDHQTAMDQFQRLEERAHFQADRLDMRMRQAEVLRRQKRYAEAAELLWNLEKGWQDEWGRELLAEVVYHRARIAIDAGHVDKGQELLLNVIDRFPHQTYGWRAFVYMRSRVHGGEGEDFIAWCRRGYNAHYDTPLADNFIYEAARALFERDTEAGDARAVPLYREILDRWRLETSGLWDDALWDLSLIHHRRGRFADELRLLQLFLSTREDTWLGSYELANYKHAAMRIAKVYYLDLKDYDRAAEAFGEFPETFPKSLLKDDALWWQGHALARAGREQESQQVFAALLRDYPESKYARRVREGAPAP